MDALDRRESVRAVLTEATLRQDAATSLPNFFAFLHEAPAVLQTTSGIALLLDIAGLRAVNAQAGSAAGDALVALMGSSLRELLPATTPDAPRAYRIGDDEFLLLLPGVKPDAAGTWTSRVNGALASGMPPDDNLPAPRVQCSCVAYPGATGSLAELLDAVYRRADAGRSDQAGSIVQRLLERIDETLSLLVEAKRQAHTDVVSGLPNHRAAESALSAALSSPTFGTVSVLLVDGDDLRAYNDLGYEAGNQMIRDLGSMLGERLREGDLLARWLSGDEYLIILHGAGSRDAHAIADRLRRHVSRHTANWPIPITVSIGVASAPEDGRTVERLVRTVEQRAAQAKRSGKDCVA